MYRSTGSRARQFEDADTPWAGDEKLSVVVAIVVYPSLKLLSAVLSSQPPKLVPLFAVIVAHKRHLVMGEEVPDENARRPVLKYVNARRAEWPRADFIIGNSPFLGNWRMRGELGDGYAETLRSVYSEVPETADYVMYWWHRAAERVRSGETRANFRRL